MGDGLPRFSSEKDPPASASGFLHGPFFRKRGEAFKNSFTSGSAKWPAGKIDLDVQLDLVRYIKLYLSYAEANEAYVDHLYRGWRFEQRMVFAVTVGVCFFVG